jgi:AbiV family abortive infection protein
MSNRRRNEAPLPKPEDANAGAALALTNARRHLRAAEILGDERLFGSATAHVVLAIEEVAKAWVLTLIGMGFDVPKSMVRQILKSHDARHSFTIGSVFVGAIRYLVLRSSIRVQKRHKVKAFPPELRDEWVNEV